jgi:hypothetical protein
MCVPRAECGRENGGELAGDKVWLVWSAGCKDSRRRLHGLSWGKAIVHRQG